MLPVQNPSQKNLQDAALGWGWLRWLGQLHQQTPFGVRLFGAFALVIAVGISAVYLLFNAALAPSFRNFSHQNSQMHAKAMAPLLAYYYTQNQGWEGVGSLLKAMDSGHERAVGEHFILQDSQGQVMPSDSMHSSGNAMMVANTNGHGVPVMVGDQTVGMLMSEAMLGRPSGLEQSFVASINRSIGLAGLVAVAVAILVGALLIWQSTRPLQRLTTAALRIASGDLQQRVEIHSRDELGRLAQAFNIMSQKLAHSEELRRHMTADIAHELRSPLAVVRANLEALKDGVFEPTPERIEFVRQEAALLERLVNDLRELNLADAGELPLHRSNLIVQDLLERVISLFGPQFVAKGVQLKLETPPNPIQVQVDSDRIGQVLSNLLSNALRYTSAGGQVAVKTWNGGQEVFVAIEDTGSGISNKDLPHVFERFWRADPSRTRESGGTGLGLAIAKQLIEAHGGKIWAESTPTQGSKFTICLPQKTSFPS